MTLRNKKQSGYEVDIENARAIKDWNSVEYLLRKYAKISPDSLLENLARAEHALENYDISKARVYLDKAKRLDEHNEEVLAMYGRMEFVGKDIDKAYGYLSSMHMPPNDQILFPRTVRYLLQSWQMKGLCQEARHEYKQAANTYRELLDLAKRTYNNLTTIDVLAQPFVETALCNLPLLQFDDVLTSIQLSRQALHVPFELSSSARLSTLRHLAHLLLRDTCTANYPQLQEEPASGVSSVYTPRTANEEALLALLKSSQDTSSSSVDLYEDICLAYSRLTLYSPIVDAYERLLSYQIGDVHQLMQLALSLMSSRRYRRALYVIQDCVTRDPANPVFLLLATKLCINHLRQTQTGLEYAEAAVNILEDKPENIIWTARAKMAVGICYEKLALESKSFEFRKDYQKRALQNLLTAFQMDPKDSVTSFHLALIYADIRDITRALKFVRKCLSLDKTNSQAWGLLALLLSSQKRFTVALSVTAQALAENPADIRLTLIKAKLEEVLDEPMQALQTYKSAFAQYSIILEDETANQPPEPPKNLDLGSVHSAGTAETRTTHRRTLQSADDSVSVALSLPRSHVLSLHTNSKDHPDEVPAQTNPMLTHLWLATAEAFAQAGQYMDAAECLQEARGLDPNNAELFYQEGCMMEMQDMLSDAVVQYQRVLAIEFSHIMARIRIATICQKSKDLNLAEQILSAVLRMEPTSHQAWFQLGCILKEKTGEEKRTVDCFQRAVELDKTAPVLPFNTIPRVLP